MDVQFLCNVYACVHYSVSYNTKDEREMCLPHVIIYEIDA